MGKYQFPLGKGDIRLLRMAKPFWNILGEHSVFSNILRVPITFPPEKFYGVLLSAMCVPDLRGTQGMFSFYTTGDRDKIAHTGGENFQVSRNGNTIHAELIGPENPFYKEKKEMRCPFTVTFNDSSSEAILKINGSTQSLKKNVYTDWVEVNFKAVPGIKVRGICQFLLRNIHPKFELYVTPIHISPDKPAMPISYPSVYSTYLAKKQGPYATLGLAEDSWALNERVIDEAAFLHQCIQADEEREVMYFDAIDKVQKGLCVCVFDGTDRMQHIFWRYNDNEHPANKTLPDERNDKVIEELYQRMDVIVGKTMAKCSGEDALFMVISDHGFNSFRYGVDLNRWLEETGYLKVKEDQRDQEYLKGVDWSQTRAYAIGLAGIYLNIQGREAQGTVEPGTEAEQLRTEISEKLTGLLDAKNDQIAIRKAYQAIKAYQGPYKGDAPDIIIGYNKNYRVSWETAIGKITDKIFHENIKAWSGDHCIDPSLVPGVLFCNRSIADENPRLIDIAPTVLDLFGVSVPKHMDGRALTVADRENNVQKDHDNHSY